MSSNDGVIKMESGSHDGGYTDEHNGIGLWRYVKYLQCRILFDLEGYSLTENIKCDDYHDGPHQGQ